MRDATTVAVRADADPAAPAGPGTSANGGRPRAADVAPGGPSRAAEGGMLAMLVALAVGLGTAWSFWPRGGVTAGTVLLCVTAPVVAAAAWRLRAARIWLSLLAVWSLAAAVTEFVVHDPPLQALYALCRPLAVALSFCGGVWAFSQGGRVTRAYAVAVVTGLVAATALYPSANMVQDPWKYGYGPVATLAVVLLAATLLGRRRRMTATVLVLGVAVASLLLGFRSEFVVTALAAVVGMLTAGRRPGRRGRSYLLTGGVLCALVATLDIGYGYLAAGGELGVGQQTRFEQQSRVEGGLLMGARPEAFASAMTIADGSLIGRGVAPAVDGPTRAAFLDRLRELGVEVHGGVEAYYFSRGLYLHSVLFQTWAEVGVLAVPAVLLPLLLVLRALMAAVRSGSGPGALVFCFLFTQLTWDTLFSSWPRLQAVYLGTAAAAAVVYMARHPLRQPEVKTS